MLAASVVAVLAAAPALAALDSYLPFDSASRTTHYEYLFSAAEAQTWCRATSEMMTL